MKRFITYLYHCRNATKGKGAGFIRVDQRGQEIIMEVHLKDLGSVDGEGRIYLLEEKDPVEGILVGVIPIRRGVADEGYRLEGRLPDILGVAIRYDGGSVVSSWRDEDSPALLQGTLREVGNEPGEEEKVEAYANREETKEEQCEELCEEYCENLYEPSEDNADRGIETIRIPEQPQETTKMQRVSLAYLRRLPPRNRHLCSNNFLIHGFYNYNYLILKEVQGPEGRKISLGVPGIYELPENSMAKMYGFQRFESLEEGGGPIREGTFGAWFIDLNP